MCGRSVTFRKTFQFFFGATPQIRGAALVAIEGVSRWGRAATAPQAAEPRKFLPYRRLLLTSLSLTLLTACQSASSRQPEPVSVGPLTKEYQESNSDTRRKYDGREITVKGLAVMTAMMPPSAGEQGLVFLEEQGANPARRVTCWFSSDQGEQFSKVKAGKFITVKGIFNGEAGAELKFCKLVKIE